MEEVYDLNQHTYGLSIYIGAIETFVGYMSSSTRSVANDNKILRKDTCIAYNKHKRNILGWGNDTFKSENEDDVLIDSFAEKLYQISKKETKNWSQDDLFILEAVSDYMCLLVNYAIEENIQYKEGTDSFFYILIVPSYWDEEMREVLLRPIFVQAGLVSSEDNKNRLFFCSEIESTLYHLMDKDTRLLFLGKTKNLIMCKHTSVYGSKKTLIELDLISTVNPIFDFPGSLVYPKVERSDSISLSIEDITDGIKVLLVGLSTTVQEEIIQFIMSIKYDDDFSERDEKDGTISFMKPLNIDTSKWILEKHQEDLIRSISLFNICSKISKNILDNMERMFSDISAKDFFVIIFNARYSTGESLDRNLRNWSFYLAGYSKVSLETKKGISGTLVPVGELEDVNILSGAFTYGLDALQNSDIYSKPRIISIRDSIVSSSIFLKSKPGAIMNIDISLESTLLSFSVLDENGFIKEIWNNDYFLANTSLRSLGSFFNFSEVITLNVKYSFIAFAQEYLMGDEDIVLERSNMTELEDIMDAESHGKDLLVSTRQREYIDAFMLAYMIYNKNIVSSKLSVIVGHNISIKIGYAIAIEKMVLNGLFESDENLKDVIYRSGLLRKDDSSKKLRVIIQGERLLPIIQQYFELPFPVKSYFIVSRLHDDYVQMTLNQVVTESSEKDQESIVIQDEILRIPNIYDTVCFNMWSNIVEDNSLIQLCDIHKQSNNKDLLDIFSLENINEFTNSFKQYISTNVLNNDSISQYTDITEVRLSTSCNCKAVLTFSEIVDISFKPLLQEIITLVSTSVKNRLFFGEYTYIQYVFHQICFNYNLHLQHILMTILKNKSNQFMYERQIDTPHYIIPKILGQLLQPVLWQLPLSYKGFQIGDLHHVHGESYGFSYKESDCYRYSTYQSYRSDTKTYSWENGKVISLYKKGDKIRNNQVKRTLYLDLNNYSDYIFPSYFKLKNVSGLSLEKTLCMKDPSREDEFTRLEKDYRKENREGTIVISIAYKGFSSSLSLTTNWIGEEMNEEYLVELSEPMTLARF